MKQAHSNSKNCCWHMLTIQCTTWKSIIIGCC